MRSPARGRVPAGGLPLKYHKGGARRVNPKALDKTPYSRLVRTVFKTLGHVLRRSEIYRWFELNTDKPAINKEWKRHVEKVLIELPCVSSAADAKGNEKSLLICDTCMFYGIPECDGNFPCSACSEDGLSCEGEGGGRGAEWAEHEDEILLGKVNLSRYCNTNVPRIFGRTEIAVVHRWMYLERRKGQHHLCDY
ncbi:hypothetical protein CGCFRS4_v015935 [Colletotrichum fructicola]|nr:hypothetical protein CGCFRS4_v015935 [Colletotrichum fructicola]